jgi:tRNA(Arg) A34 adenosine deaminase TadA
VRNRIFTTERPPVPASALGAVKVAARKLHAGVVPLPGGTGLPADLPLVDAGALAPPPRRAPPALDAALAALVAAASAAGPLDERRAAALARRLADEVARLRPGEPGTDRPDKAVAALLLGPGGELLGWAVNTGSKNAMRHAEANLLDVRAAGASAPLPRGATLLATLKPCKMCAGLIWDAASDRAALRVLYLDEDPLRYARETVLDAGSVERRRVARDRAEAARVVQRRIEESS